MSQTLSSESTSVMSWVSYCYLELEELNACRHLTLRRTSRHLMNRLLSLFKSGRRIDIELYHGSMCDCRPPLEGRSIESRCRMTTADRASVFSQPMAIFRFVFIFPLRESTSGRRLPTDAYCVTVLTSALDPHRRKTAFKCSCISSTSSATDATVPVTPTQSQSAIALPWTRRSGQEYQPHCERPSAS